MDNVIQINCHVLRGHISKILIEVKKRFFSSVKWHTFEIGTNNSCRSRWSRDSRRILLPCNKLRIFSVSYGICRAYIRIVNWDIPPATTIFIPCARDNRLTVLDFCWCLQSLCARMDGYLKCRVVRPINWCEWINWPPGIFHFEESAAITGHRRFMAIWEDVCCDIFKFIRWES